MLWLLIQLPLHRHKIEVEMGMRTQLPSSACKKLIGPSYIIYVKSKKGLRGPHMGLHLIGVGVGGLKPLLAPLNLSHI